MNCRVLFLGTPEFAVPSLRMLIRESYDIAGVVTQPDRPKGRGGKLAAPAVKIAALESGVRVLQPDKPSQIYDELESLQIDLCVTAAYGNILKKRFLKIPRFGTVNVHASLLPAYRGPSPIHRALLNGDATTGVTTMLTDAGVDTGAILMSSSLIIGDEEDFASLHDRLAELGADLLKQTIPALVSGKLVPQVQDDGLATYAQMVQKSDGELNFNLSAVRLVNTVRAFGAWPGAAAIMGGKKIKVLKASVGPAACGGRLGHAALNENLNLAIVNGNTGYVAPNNNLDPAAPIDGPAQFAQNGNIDRTFSIISTDKTVADGNPDHAVLNNSQDLIPGSVASLNRGALSIMCGDGRLLNITRLQFENGRPMDISECWHNLRGLA